MKDVDKIYIEAVRARRDRNIAIPVATIFNGFVAWGTKPRKLEYSVEKQGNKTIVTFVSPDRPKRGRGTSPEKKPSA